MLASRAQRMLLKGLCAGTLPSWQAPPPPIYPPGAPVGATLSAGTLNMHSSCNVTLQACCFVKHADMVCQHVETALAGTGGCRIPAALWWLHKPPPTPPPTPPAYTFDPKQFATCRAPWSPALEQYESTAEVQSPAGQTLFKGFAAKVNLQSPLCNSSFVCANTCHCCAIYMLQC